MRAQRSFVTHGIPGALTNWRNVLFGKEANSQDKIKIKIKTNVTCKKYKQKLLT